MAINDSLNRWSVADTHEKEKGSIAIISQLSLFTHESVCNLQSREQVAISGGSLACSPDLERDPTIR